MCSRVNGEVFGEFDFYRISISFLSYVLGGELSIVGSNLMRIRHHLTSEKMVQVSVCPYKTKGKEQKNKKIILSVLYASYSCADWFNKVKPSTSPFMVKSMWRKDPYVSRG